MVTSGKAEKQRCSPLPLLFLGSPPLEKADLGPSLPPPLSSFVHRISIMLQSSLQVAAMKRTRSPHQQEEKEGFSNLRFACRGGFVL